MKYLLLLLSLFFYYNGKSQTLTGEDLEYAKQLCSRTAKQTWWFFDKRLKEPQAYRYQHVYIEFQNIYIKDIQQLPSGKYKGIVNLDLPHDSAFTESNREITFDSMEIDDWFMVEDVYLIGGFGVRIMPFEERQLILRKGRCKLPQQCINDDFIESSKMPPSADNIKLSEEQLNKIFQGGQKAFLESLRKKLYFTEFSMMMGLEGWVTLQFNIEEDGSLSKVKVLRGIGGGLNDIARNILFDLKDYFLPHKATDFPEPLTFTLPIRFRYDSW